MLHSYCSLSVPEHGCRGDCFLLLLLYILWVLLAGERRLFFGGAVFTDIMYEGVPWLYPVEINSLSMRTKGAALATGMNWIINYAVVQATPPGIDRLGWKFYLIWMSFNIAIVPVSSLGVIFGNISERLPRLYICSTRRLRIGTLRTLIDCTESTRG